MFTYLEIKWFHMSIQNVHAWLKRNIHTYQNKMFVYSEEMIMIFLNVHLSQRDVLCSENKFVCSKGSFHVSLTKSFMYLTKIKNK